MGKKSSDAPAPPDPRETSKAQTGTSVATALANTSLGNVSRVGADGSTLDYKVSGNTNFTDPYTGLTYALPQYTATEKLSAPAQAIYDTRQGAEQNLATAAKTQSGNVSNMFSQAWSPDLSAYGDAGPTQFKADTADIERRLFELGSSTLNPQFERQRNDLETRLSNQGIKLGSAAYDRALNEQGNTQNQAYNQLALQGRGQAYNEILSTNQQQAALRQQSLNEQQTIRNQPLNELSALFSGSQVSMPNYAINQPSAIPTTDNAGLVQANYGQQQQNYQTDQAKQQSLWGGLFGLGSAAIMSDQRTKTDIEKVGKTDDGQNIYKYRYKAGGPIQMGLMAQEVEKKHPDAVVKKGGIRFVDYGKALK
jgi:hypothetical protein